MKGKHVFLFMISGLEIVIAVILLAIGGCFKAYAGGSMFLILGIIMMAGAVREYGFDKKLYNEGLIVEGEIMQTKREDRLLYAQIRYTAEDGTVQLFEDCFFSGVHRPGDRLYLRYAQKKNGKYVAQALDRG